jgi:hypothetical protein
VLASLAMLARDRRALRVAAGGSAPPISFVALRGLGAARSGRESRFAIRTGKLDLRGCRPDDSVALRIEGDDANRLYRLHRVGRLLGSLVQPFLYPILHTVDDAPPLPSETLQRSRYPALVGCPKPGRFDGQAETSYF